MLEVLVMFGLIILLIIMDRFVRKYKINFKFVYLNYIILFIFIFILALLLIPNIGDLLLKYTGFLPRDFIIALSIAYLLYTSFIQSLIIAKQNEQIEKIAIILSVKDIEKENQ